MFVQGLGRLGGGLRGARTAVADPLTDGGTQRGGESSQFKHDVRRCFLQVSICCVRLNFDKSALHNIHSMTGRLRLLVQRGYTLVVRCDDCAWSAESRADVSS